MIEAIGVNFVPKGVAILIAGFQLPILIFWHVVIAVEICVSSNSDMLDAGQIDYVVDMINHMENRCGILVANEHPNACDAHHTSFVAKGLDGIVGFQPRMVYEGATIAVGDRNRLGRQCYRIKRCLIAAVGHVNQHTDLVHSLDDGKTKVADAPIDALCSSGAKQILVVVGELRCALA